MKKKQQTWDISTKDCPLKKKKNQTQNWYSVFKGKYIQNMLDKQALAEKVTRIFLR